MGLVVRQSIFTTIISYTGAVIGYVNLLYLYPKFLDPEQVGLLRAVQDAAILFAPFAQFGLSNSILRYYPQLVKNKDSEGGFLTLVLLLALGGFVIFLVVFKIFEGPILHYFDDNASAMLAYIPTILWLTFIMLTTALLESYSRSLLKTVFPNLLREVGIRVMLMLLVTAYFLGWLTFEAFIVSTVAAYLLWLLALLIYLILQKKISLNAKFDFITKEKRREVIQYSLLSFAGAAGMIIIGKIDSLMIAGMLGLDYVAVYTTAFYMASVIEVPKRAIAAVAMPLIAQSFEKKDIAHINLIYQKTSLNQFIVGALFLIGIVINLDNIYQLMPKKEVYEAGRWVVVFVGVGKLADMLFGPSSEIVVLSKYFWFNIVLVSLLAATVIIANNLLIPDYGIDGAAMSVAIALILFNVAKYAFIWATMRIQPFRGATLVVMAIAGISLLINYFIPRMENVFVDILVRSAVVTVFYGGAVLATKVSEDVNRVVRKGLRLLGL